MTQDMTDDVRQATEERLEALREEHRDLDDSITALERAGTFDQLQVQRLKKRKLMIRDQMAYLTSQLHPDIIA